jgi:hypothetical protein
MLTCLFSCTTGMLAQNCYKSIAGHGVQVGTVSSSGLLCVTQLCLGSGYSELQKVIDDDIYTGASYSSLASVLTSGGLSVKNNDSVYPAGFVAGYLFSSSQVLDLTILNGISVSTYLDGTLQETKTAGALLSSNILSGSTQKTCLTFITSTPFNEVRFKTAGLSVAVLNSIKVYTAYAFSSAGCGAPANPSCDKPISGIATAVSYDGQGVCALCSLTNPQNINDANNDNYASLTIPAGVLSSPTVGVLNTSVVYPAGYRAGFVINQSGSNALLSVALVNSVVIETYLFGQKQETVTSTTSSGGSLLNAEAFSQSGDTRNKVGFITTMPFNEVRFRQNQAVGVTLGTTRIYYAFAEPATCQDCKIYLGSAPTGKYSGALVNNVFLTTYTGTYGIAIQSLVNTGNAISPSITDYATYNSPLVAGILAGAKLTVKNDGTLFPAGTTAGFDLIQTGGLLNASVLNAITIRTFKITGSTIQLVEENSGGSELIGLSVIGGAPGKASVGFKAAQPFNAIQVDINSGIINAGIGGTTQLYGAFVIEDADSDGFGDCKDICPTGDDAHDRDYDGIPDTCDICNAGNIAPYIGNTTFRTNCPSQTVALPDSAYTKLAGTIFEWHSALPATAANKLTSAQAHSAAPGVYYAVFADTVNHCYSPPTLATVLDDCFPDLTPTFIFRRTSLIPGQSSNATCTISNIGFKSAMPANGTIRVRIAKPDPTSGYTISSNGTMPSITIFSATPVDNSKWDFTEDAYNLTFTLHTNEQIPADASMVLGFTVTRSLASLFSNAVFVNATIRSGSGGEVNVTNDQVGITISSSN